MQRYAAARGCRRAVIARYFGESRPDCGGCDRCRYSTAGNPWSRS
ncbi:MAG: RecQ family zinc-binding domain-containing protein [marine benthic group bacterium]|nr:RecQ family zinc-binding domain-containing protein [Gemmatimonadota bacterium]